MLKSNPEDVNVICTEDCGNAPKKLVLRDLNIAFARNDKAYILEQISDDVVWYIVGSKKVIGKDQFSKELSQMKLKKAIEIEINHIITHGNAAAANGVIRYIKGNYSFCDVYLFNSFRKNAKIKEITSYIIE